MRSITVWLLLASAHQEPVPFQVTAAGSCAQVTRPGTTPRGIPSGDSVDANSEERNVVAAARDRANFRRVIPMLSYSSELELLPGSVSLRGQTAGAPHRKARRNPHLEPIRLGRNGQGRLLSRFIWIALPAESSRAPHFSPSSIDGVSVGTPHTVPPLAVPVLCEDRLNLQEHVVFLWTSWG